MEAKVSNAIAVYRRLISHPEPTSATFSNKSLGQKFVVNSVLTQSDLERSEKVVFTKNYLLSLEEPKHFSTEYKALGPEKNSNELWNVESPSGNLQAVVKKFTPKKGDEKQFIEIWDNNSKIQNFDVLAEEKHGKIYENDKQFGCLQWSASEKKLLYLAEKKQPKSVSFFQKQKKEEEDKAGKEEDKAGKEDVTVGTEHDYIEDWGEQLKKKHKSVLCVLDVETGDIQVLDGIPDHLTLGQGLWAPDDEGLVFVGWSHEPYRLGLIYCPIRKSEVYYWDFKSSTLKQISDSNKASFSPRFSPDKSKLIYLDNEVGGPHMQCSRLMMYDWKKQKLSTVIDIVKDPKVGEFPGLFVSGLLLDRCWSQDNTRIVLNSCWRSHVVTLVINTETKSVIPCKSETGGGIRILDVYEDRVLSYVTAVNQLPCLCISSLPEVGKEDSMTFVPMEVPKKISEISFEVLQFQPTDRPHSKFGVLDYEATLIMPKTSSQEKPPLIAFPHGGPHSLFTTDFLLFTACYSLCGFAVLQINYRGSFGFGDNNLRSLPGNVGTQDVQDCQCAVESVVASGKVDKDNIFVFGGSHGGFLTTHLIGQYPKFYKAACCRNPVTNISTMVGTSDIPDWCFTEAGYEFDHTSMATEEVLTAMWTRSPMQYINQVQTPLLVMLGLDDNRVPPRQGMEYYKQLKARNVETRLLTYEENNHPIAKVDAQADCCINILQWFFKHLSKAPVSA